MPALPVPKTEEAASESYCRTCPYQCDACEDITPLYTYLDQAIDDTAAEQQLYGRDGQATISWEHAGAQSNQGDRVDVYPDIQKKVNGVENNFFKQDKKEREDFTGTRTKTFSIYGEITIDETQSGDLCEATNTCENGTGYNDAESLQRVGDACAYAPQVSSASYNDGCPCDYKTTYPKTY